MEHADTAQLAALGGALGSVLVLLGRGRLPLLAGLALLGAAELGARVGARRGSARQAERRVRGRRRGACPGGARRRDRAVREASGDRPDCGARGRAAAAAAVASTAPARCSCRSPTTGGSAGSCRSTSCSPRRPQPWRGGRCADASCARCPYRWRCRPRRSSPSPAARSCGRTTWRPARTSCCSSPCPSWPCSPPWRARATRPGPRVVSRRPRSRSPRCSRRWGCGRRPHTSCSSTRRTWPRRTRTRTTSA